MAAGVQRLAVVVIVGVLRASLSEYVRLIRVAVMVKIGDYLRESVSVRVLRMRVVAIVRAVLCPNLSGC